MIDATFIAENEEMIIDFGAFGYDAAKIANITNQDAAEIDRLLKDPDSEFFLLYKKGIDMSDYVIDKKLLEMARSGDLKAIEKFELRKKIRRK